MERKWLEMLAKTPLFREIERTELQSMLECLKPTIATFKRDEFIAVAGIKFDGIGILLEGAAVIVKENVTGNRMVLTVLNPGDMFGEMAAFSGKAVWPASVLTQEESTVVFLPPDKIVGACGKVCDFHKKMVYNMLGVLSQKALLLNRKVEYLAMKTLRGKIASFLLEQTKTGGKQTFLLSMNRDELADFLGVSRPSLSREMGRMRDEGVIEYHRSSVKIRDVETLKQMVE